MQAFHPDVIADIDSQAADELAYAISTYKSSLLGRSIKREHIEELKSLGFFFPPYYTNVDQHRQFFLNWVNENPKYKRNNIAEVLLLIRKGDYTKRHAGDYILE